MSTNTHIICVRDVKKEQFIAEPGKTQFLTVPETEKSYSPSNSMTKSKWRKSVMDAADGKVDLITGMQGDVLIFVHGYNNSIEVVLERTRALQRSLREQGWKGVVVGFDWPSENSTLNYLEDRSDASEVAIELVRESLELLIETQSPSKSTAPACKLNVHLLGHSTGAYVILQAFEQAKTKGSFFKSPWRIGQVAFIAGDVSVDSLKKDKGSHPIFERIMRLTNYSNGCDKVLAVSNAKRIGTSPRVGRVGISKHTVLKAVNVDCTDYFKTIDPNKYKIFDTFNHSWHIGDPVFALDLAMTLEGGIDRNHIPCRVREDGALKLIAGASRPKHQGLWDLSSSK